MSVGSVILKTTLGGFCKNPISVNRFCDTENYCGCIFYFIPMDRICDTENYCGVFFFFIPFLSVGPIILKTSMGVFFCPIPIDRTCDTENCSGCIFYPIPINWICDTSSRGIPCKQDLVLSIELKNRG